MNKIKEFFKFDSLDNPHSLQEDKWKELWYSFKFGFKVEIVTAFIIVLLVYFFAQELEIFGEKVFFNEANERDILYNIFLLVSGAIVEELMFRLHLDFKIQNILISILVAGLFLFHKFDFIQFLFIGVLLILFIYILKSGNVQRISQISKVYIILNSMIFALSHVPNFSILTFVNFPVLFLGLSIKFFIGLLLCRIRLLNNGIEWSIYLHLMFNLLPFISSFLGSLT